MAAASDPKLVALVPMRHQSERVPGKNYRPLDGKPLYAYILETLLSCRSIDLVAVDTDSPVVRSGVAERFPAVQLIDRPEHLRGGEVPTNDILVHDAGLLPAPFYLQTHSTNPLLRAETIERAVATFRHSYPAHDSLFSVTRWHKRLWTAEGKPVNHDPKILLRTQDLEPVFEENSCLYLFERAGFLERRNRLGKTPLLFEMDPLEALDIDEEHDFALVESMIHLRKLEG